MVELISQADDMEQLDPRHGSGRMHRHTCVHQVKWRACGPAGQYGAPVVKNIVKRTLLAAGYEVRKKVDDALDPVETRASDEAIWNAVKPFTMTSRFRVLALISAVRYIVTHRVPGDLVECGVWRGGSAMAMALTLSEMGASNRKIWLYDTFSGMTAPTTHDVDRYGSPADEQMSSIGLIDGHSAWCFSPREQVEANMQSTGLSSELVEYVEGDVVETLGHTLPGEIALLRLDTDWYESTAAEMRTLYPLVSSNGVCIIDDFGHWTGARQAVLEYFQEHPPAPLLNRVDYSGRLIIKPSNN